MGSFCIKEDTYPSRLKNIRNCPKELFVKGDSDIIKSDLTIGIVGPRKPTEYGKRVVKKLIQGFKGLGFVIVSGFMYGIDSFAHREALDNGLRTIAVLPYGIDLCPPTYQRDLYKDIVSKGCIVSEYFGVLKAQKWMFSERNRIVAGLSKALLIVEAAENSGTLITASYAQKFNRQIFAVPGEIFSKNSYGTNELIKKGALAVTSSEDILCFYGLQSVNQEMKPIFSNSTEAKIYDLLCEKPQNLANIVENLDIPAREVSYLLTNMQLSGILQEEKGILSVS